MLNGLAFVHEWLYQRVAEYAVPDWGRRETHNPLPEALHLEYCSRISVAAASLYLLHKQWLRALLVPQSDVVPVFDGGEVDEALRNGGKFRLLSKMTCC